MRREAETAWDCPSGAANDPIRKFSLQQEIESVTKRLGRIPALAAATNRSRMCPTC